MIEHLIPGLLFGWGPIPVPAEPVAPQHMPFPSSRVETPRNGKPFDAACGLSASPRTWWSERFSHWSSKSSEAMVAAINAEDRASAEMHDMRVLLNVWRALSEITDFELTDFEAESKES